MVPDKVQKVGNKMVRAGAKANGAIFVNTFSRAKATRLPEPGVRWIEPLIGSLTGVPVHPNATGEQQDSYDVELAMLKPAFARPARAQKDEDRPPGDLSSAGILVSEAAGARSAQRAALGLATLAVPARAGALAGGRDLLRVAEFVEHKPHRR